MIPCSRVRPQLRHEGEVSSGGLLPTRVLLQVAHVISVARLERAARLARAPVTCSSPGVPASLRHRIGSDEQASALIRLMVGECQRLERMVSDLLMELTRIGWWTP